MMNRKTGKYQATYATFETVGKDDGAMFYQYCGNCFVGETQDMDIYRPYASVNEYLKATFRMEYGMAKSRPHIICKDGFEFSVQAGRFLYSTPRADGASNLSIYASRGYRKGHCQAWRLFYSRYSGGIKPPDLNKSQSNSGGKKNE